MSYPADENQHRAHVAAVVRRNVWSAAIAAVLLCYYGFGTSLVLTSDATALFKFSARMFDYTLQVGGIVMAIVAVWCWLGLPSALAVDGVASLAIGVIFVLSGGGMLVDSGAGFNTILIILFGMMFFGAGRHNWQTYRHLAAGGRVLVEPYTETFTPPVRPEAPTTRSPDPAPGVATPVRPIEDVCAGDTTPTEQGDTDEEEAPPEGFLAAMAKKPPPSTPSADRFDNS